MIRHEINSATFSLISQIHIQHLLQIMIKRNGDINPTETDHFGSMVTNDQKSNVTNMASSVNAK